MNIFEQKPPALQIGEYELTEGPYKGGIVKYRALLPLGYQLLHDTPLSNRLMDIKIDLQDVVAQQEYLDSLSNEASSHLTLERSIQLVLGSVIYPKLNGALPEYTPPGEVSIYYISERDISAIRKGITEISGVGEAEATFPEPTKDDNADSGEPEPDGAKRSEDGNRSV